MVDIHAEDVTLEAIQVELTHHPWRIDEKRSVGFDDTPLGTAAKAGNVAVLVFLLSLGANVEAKNEVFAFFFCNHQILLKRGIQNVH